MKINRNLLKVSRLLHVYLSVFLLLVLVFFAITGILLNHPDWFEGQSEESIHYVKFDSSLPVNIHSETLSPSLWHFLERELGLNKQYADVEVDGDLLFIEQQKPGVSISVEMDISTGEAEVITTHRGIIATLNELHKGRHAKQLWLWLIDISAILVVIFSLSGLLLLLPQKKRVGKIVLYSLLSLPLLIYAGIIY